MAVATSDELLGLLRRSGIVPADRVAVWLAENPDATTGTPRELAVRLISAGLVTGFQAKLLLQGRFKGFKIADKYKILDLLGSGGMGAVYLCEHLSLKTPVAVKVLPAALAENPEARERFYREARAFATLNHPNVVRGFDVDSDGKVHFIVMEYVDGVDLQALVSKRGPLPVGRAANYIRQAAWGLHHAHDRGWVHRDIKPANIAVDRHGTARVLDMGLARLMTDATDGITRNYSEGSILGTADYLAPEQATGATVDGRADVYSLGGTLYFLFTARLPYGDGNTAQKLVAHQLRPPPPITEFRQDLPRGLVAVLDKMLAKKPDDRFRTAGELADALAAWDEGGPYPPEQGEIPRRLPPGLAPPASAVHNLTPGPHSPNRATVPLTPPVGAPQPTAPLSADQLAEATREAAAGATTAVGRAAGARVPLWAVLAVVGLAVAGVGYVGYGYLFPDRSKGAPVLEKSPFTGVYVPVTRYYGPQRRSFPGGFNEFIDSGKLYPTVAEALADPRAARDGCRILLCDETHAEQADLDLSKLPPGVIIESARPLVSPVRWVPPDAAGAAKPLLAVAGGSRVTVRGLTFDGQHRVDTGVVLTRPGPGTRLENVVVTKVGRTGVVVAGAAGDPDDPVRIQDVRVRTDGPAPVDAGLSVVPDKPETGTRHLVVSDCRFDGPGQAGVAAAGPVEFLELTRSRVYGLRHAVRFDGPGRLRATLAGNTVAEVQAGVVVAALPADDDADTRLVLRNNLFIRVTAAAQLPAGVTAARAANLFRGSGGNGCETGGCPVPTLGLTVRPHGAVQLGLDPARDTEFLFYPPNSPLTTAGTEGQPVGVSQK